MITAPPGTPEGSLRIDGVTTFQPWEESHRGTKHWGVQKPVTEARAKAKGSCKTGTPGLPVFRTLLLHRVNAHFSPCYGTDPGMSTNRADTVGPPFVEPACFQLYASWWCRRCWCRCGSLVTPPPRLLPWLTRLRLAGHPLLPAMVGFWEPLERCPRRRNPVQCVSGQRPTEPHAREGKDCAAHDPQKLF